MTEETIASLRHELHSISTGQARLEARVEALLESHGTEVSKLGRVLESIGETLKAQDRRILAVESRDLVRMQARVDELETRAEKQSTELSKLKIRLYSLVVGGTATAGAFSTLMVKVFGG